MAMAGRTRGPGADLRPDAAGDVRAAERRRSTTWRRPSFELGHAAASGARVRLRLSGAHQVDNALAAAAVALAAGVPLDRRGRALGRRPSRPRRWRMELHERADGVTVVNDAYNANPDSMRAALEALVAIGGGAGAGPSPSSARCASWATVATPGTTRSARRPRAWASTGRGRRRRGRARHRRGSRAGLEQ